MNAPPHNIVLVGFMGTGKSTVGRLVADHLGWPLVELDAEIERKEGRPISEIFEQQGEVYFREIESRLVAEFAGHKEVVLSCGGGVVLDPGNIENLERLGVLICLKADEAVLLERVGRETNRPLLEYPDKSERLRALLRQRKPLYDKLSNQIDTTGKTPEAIRDEILTRWDNP